MVSKLTGGLAGIVLGIVALAPGAAFAASPAAFDTRVEVDSQDADPCVAQYSLGACDRPGGFAARGQKASLLTFDGGDVVRHLSNDGGVTWNGGNKMGGSVVSLPVLAQDGVEVAFAYRDEGQASDIRTGWGFGVQDIDTPSFGFASPRQVTTQLAADVERGQFFWVAAGYDEVSAGRKTNAIRVHHRTDGIGNVPVTRTIAWNGVGCLPKGTDPVIAAMENGSAVLAYWQSCTKLVVRRFLPASNSFSKPVTLSTGMHVTGMAIEAQGKTVVLAYTAGDKTLVRRSTDGGKTWSAAKQVGSGARSLRLTFAGDAWHLLAGGETSIRYRRSSTGASWSAGTTVDSLQGARTYALGVAVGGGKVLAAYAIREAQSDYGIYVSAR
jgi:hypothetical protein